MARSHVPVSRSSYEHATSEPTQIHTADSGRTMPNWHHSPRYDEFYCIVPESCLLVSHDLCRTLKETKYPKYHSRVSRRCFCFTNASGCKSISNRDSIYIGIINYNTVFRISQTIISGSSCLVFFRRSTFIRNKPWSIYLWLKLFFGLL